MKFIRVDILTIKAVATSFLATLRIFRLANAYVAMILRGILLYQSDDSWVKEKGESTKKRLILFLS